MALGAQAPEAIGFALFSLGALSPCGLSVPALGEILINILPPNPILTLLGGPLVGGSFFIGPVLPTEPVLTGTSIYAQAVFVLPPGVPGEPYRLTNALELNLGLKF